MRGISPHFLHFVITVTIDSAELAIVWKRGILSPEKPGFRAIPVSMQM